MAMVVAASLTPAVSAASHPDLSIRQAGTVEYQIFGDVVPGRPVVVEFRATNPLADASQGSLTVSMYGDSNLDVGLETPGAKVFRPGELMYNFARGQNVPIGAPAAELFLTSWPTGATQVLRLRLTAAQPFTLQARATFKRANGAFVHFPAAGTPDQQGAPTRLVDMAPRPAQLPATATPDPPTPVPPTATSVPPSATPPPPPTAVPPTAAPPTAAPTAAPAVAIVPPGNTPVPAPTAAPAAPTARTAVADEGPSLPLLLAGFGIMALGVAIGLVALMLVLRRRSERASGWPYPPAYQSGPYAPPPGVYVGGPQTPAGPVPPGFGQPGYASPSYAPGGPTVGVAPPETDSPDSGERPWGRSTAPLPWERAAAAGPAWPTDIAESPAEDVPAVVGPVAPHDETEEEEATPRPGSVGGVIGLGHGILADERYTQRTLVGRGGMGSVYRAYDSRLRRWVALKVMHADLGLRPGFVERFMREAQVAAMLEHPNIVTVYDIEPVGNSIQMVQSWIEGDDLQKVLQENGAMPPERAADILDQLASALDAAHLRDHPILHRDIKPSNIMLGRNDRVVLTDFGIARLIGDVSLTQTGEIVGTPAYMAPELVEGDEADGRADVYAVGVVLYQMLTGRAPFRAETPLAMLHAQLHTPPPAPRTITPTLPDAVDEVLLKALAKNPAERYQTAGEMARAFREAIGRA
jgi:hypothetical protein